MNKVLLLTAAASLLVCGCTPAKKSSLYDNTPAAPAPSDNTAHADHGGANLELWKDPDFQRNYAQSYIAETEIEPRVTVVERDQMQKVLELISAEKMDEAAVLLEKSRNDASSAVLDYTLANIYFEQDKHGQALAAYEVAVKKHPKFRRAWRNLGMIYVRRGDYEKALPAFRRVVELGGGDAATYGLMGFAYSSIGNEVSAESAYRMAILLDPETLDWKMGMARSFFKQQRYADAISLTSNLIAKDPSRGDLWLLQANAYVGLNKPQKAAENLELVDRLGQSTFASLNMLGNIYINEELYELAVSSYIRAMQLDPKGDPTSGLRAAKVLTARGAQSESELLLDEIDRVHGERLDVAQRKDILKLRARHAVADGADEQEARILEEIVALDPLDGEALILLGQHSSRGGELEKAAFYYERAASIEAYEADANVRHAQLLVSKGKYADALPLLRRAQQIKPRESIQKYLDQVERVAKGR